VTARRKAPGGDPLARLDRWLARHRRRFHRGLQPSATAAELKTLDTALARPLPPELRSLLAWHNGQKGDFVGHFEGDWDLLSSAQIADAAKELPAGCMPFLGDDNGNYLCLDMRAAGPPVKAFWTGKPELEPVASSLTACLTDFVAAVERGAYHEDPERGTLFRTDAP
jgi:cell wall assembly regulator SMI1